MEPRDGIEISKFLNFQAVHHVGISVANHLPSRREVGKPEIPRDDVDKLDERFGLRAGESESIASTVGARDGVQLQSKLKRARSWPILMTCDFLQQRQNSTNDCITTIQEEITDTISFSLREWRKNPRRRAAVLRTIKQLKEIYLKLFAIQNSCDFLEVEVDVRRLMERWRKTMRF